MAKFFGIIGFETTCETSPGVWTQKITERNYYGDFIRNTRKLQVSENLNDDINISNELSILSDPYAYENFHSIKYVEYMGALWKITSVEVKYPRLILTVGGVYNAQQNQSTETP